MSRADGPAEPDGCRPAWWWCSLAWHLLYGVGVEKKIVRARAEPQSLADEPAGAVAPVQCHRRRAVVRAEAEVGLEAPLAAAAAAAIELGDLDVARKGDPRGRPVGRRAGALKAAAGHAAVRGGPVQLQAEVMTEIR